MLTLHSLRLKLWLLAAAFTIIAVDTVYGQSAAGALAASQSAAAAGSVSGVTINNSSVPQDRNGNALGTDANPYTSELRNVPNVSAPAVFGGGHPCLAGKSGGFSIVGGGLSYGQGEAEVVCMLWVMGQPEAAIRALVAQSAAACKALNNVGYYRVGNSVVPFKCRDTVVGGIDTPGVSSSTTKVKSTRVAATTKAPKRAYAKCSFDKAANKITFSAKFLADKATAKSQCMAALGM